MTAATTTGAGPLAGPASGPTGPRQAVATPRGRYYSDPAGGPDLISVTNVLNTAVAKPALTGWAAKVTAEYVMANLPTIVRRSLRERDDVLREIKKQIRVVRESAADLGSRVHAAAEAHILGTPRPADEEVAPYARQLVAWLTTWGVDLDRDIEAAECTVAHRGLGYAGTADLLVWLPTGDDGSRELWLVDYKTSATRSAASVYPEHAMQLAAYRHAEVIWAPDGTDVPMPAVAGTAVLNLRRRAHSFIPVDGSAEVFAAFRGAVTVANHLHAAEKAKPMPLAAPSTPTTRGAA